MKSYKVLCKVFNHGSAYGKTGDVVQLPEAIGDQYTSGEKPRLKKIDETPVPVKSS